MIDLNQELFAPSHSIFDTHAHYNDEAFDPDRDELLETLHQKGVKAIVNNVRRHPPRACGTLGNGA